MQLFRFKSENRLLLFVQNLKCINRIKNVRFFPQFMLPNSQFLNLKTPKIAVKTIEKLTQSCLVSSAIAQITMHAPSLTNCCQLAINLIVSVNSPSTLNHADMAGMDKF